jgi:predicted GNAT superfamily acetyltransferase
MPLDLDDHSRASGLPDTAELVNGVDAHGYTYRAFSTPEDGAACVALQHEIWGSAFDHVSASLMKIATNIGGLAIGAFDPGGNLVGFVFSLAGMRDGEPIHWSHMLGVRESVRGAGVGRHLKELQRAELARRGIARVLWTFDPLQSRNAHLNVNRLGVRVIDYVENMYGITASPLHHGLATDRLIVMLPTTPNDVGHVPPMNGVHAALPILTPFPRPGDLTVDLDDTTVPCVLIEIPTDLQAIIASTPEVAGAWRMATRASFQRAMRRGYDVTGLRRDRATNRSFYLLAAASHTA